MGTRFWLAPVILAALTACSPKAPVEDTVGPPATEAAAAPVDEHNSRNSLDWAGTYEGVLPCADCAGIVAFLTLGQDGSYQWSTRRLAAGAASVAQQGSFTWSEDGGSVTLGTDAQAPKFMVGEGRLFAFNADGSRPSPDSAAALQRVASAAAPALVLEGHAWSLVSATGADASRIDALFPQAGGGIALAFAGGRLNVTGGCNSLRAGYQLTPEGQFTVGPAAATMMACEPPLMAADAALAALLASPMQAVLAQGASPTLALVAASGEVLQFRGEPTPETRYGPASIVFFEVGPRRVACADATSADGLCLQLREVTFDAQGLRVGEPGEFAPFGGSIEGYTHTEGTRNIIRVKQFQSDATPPGGVKVLDLVVESELVPE